MSNPNRSERSRGSSTERDRHSERPSRGGGSRRSDRARRQATETAESPTTQRASTLRSSKSIADHSVKTNKMSNTSSTKSTPQRSRSSSNQRQSQSRAGAHKQLAIKDDAEMEASNNESKGRSKGKSKSQAEEEGPICEVVNTMWPESASSRSSPSKSTKSTKSVKPIPAASNTNRTHSRSNGNRSKNRASESYPANRTNETSETDSTTKLTAKPPKPLAHLPKEKENASMGTVKMATPPTHPVTNVPEKFTSTHKDKNRFQMMDITVTILGLSGILSLTKEKKNKPSASTISQDDACLGHTNDYNNHHSTNTTKSRLTSTFKQLKKLSITNSPKSVLPSSSLNQNQYKDSVSSLGSSQNAPPPIFALVTFTRNAINSNTSISTHIPSLPLKDPNHLNEMGSISRYNAIWPTEPTKPSIPDHDQGHEGHQEHPNVENRSSFTLSRVLQRDNYKDNALNNNDNNNSPHNDDFCNDSSSLSSKSSYNLPQFIPELIEIQVGLICGGQMIQLGNSTLVVSGEANQIELNLPLQFNKAQTSFDKQKSISKTTNNTRLHPNGTNSNSNSNSKNNTNASFVSLLKQRARFTRQVKHAKSFSFDNQSFMSFQLDTQSYLRVSLDVAPRGATRENTKESRLMDCIDKSCIEVGTDNAATLWKLAPHDIYEVVEYTPPVVLPVSSSYDDTSMPMRSTEPHKLESSQDAAKDKNPKTNDTKSNRQSKSKNKKQKNTTKTDDANHELSQKTETTISSSIPPPPEIKSKTKSTNSWWHCPLDPAASFFTDDDHIKFTESMILEAQEEEKRYIDEDLLPYYDCYNYEIDDDYYDDDENSTHEDSNTYGESAASEFDDYDETGDDSMTSFDDERTSTTYDTKFLSLDSNGHSFIISEDNPTNNHSYSHNKKRMKDGGRQRSSSKNRDRQESEVDLKSVEKARATLRRFADRMGVDPEDLI